MDDFDEQLATLQMLSVIVGQHLLKQPVAFKGKGASWDAQLERRHTKINFILFEGVWAPNMFETPLDEAIETF